MESRHILVTGGCGYIGTHTVVALIEAGASVTVVDNLTNSHVNAIERVRALVPHSERITFVQVRRGGVCSSFAS